ncbi:MAG: glutamine amidotransferase [Firmicutes bacterium]|nr:glutamine amidotransferase [Bacillota bacterium]
MTIEVLYPEICNLYGDHGNSMYMAQCLPDAEIIPTTLYEKPYFADNKPDLLLAGSMSEHAQELVIKALMPYRDRLAELIEQNVPMFFPGNSGEVLFEKIVSWDGQEIPGLGLVPFTAERRHYDRFNGLDTGYFEEEGMGPVTVLGFRSEFSIWKGDNTNCHFVRIQRGAGTTKDSPYEGYRRNRLIVTQQLGPLLVNNPDLTKRILLWMGSNAPIAFEKEAQAAFEQRYKEFTNPKNKVNDV